MPGLLQVARHNAEHMCHNVAGFEIGRVHFLEQGALSECTRVGLILTGKTRPHHWGNKPEDQDFFDLKGIVEGLLEALRILR